MFFATAQMLVFRMLKNGFKHIFVFNENYRSLCQFFTSVYHVELTCLGTHYHNGTSLGELGK